ncbi:MAG TPA: hypothetical protein VEA41_16395 [Salinarimonas sp.]|nr:hypothetical protein [Salinarimonas sp.]
MGEEHRKAKAQVHVKVTEEQRALLEAAAKAAHLPLATWIRATCLREAKGKKK